MEISDSEADEVPMQIPEERAGEAAPDGPHITTAQHAEHNDIHTSSIKIEELPHAAADAQHQPQESAAERDVNGTQTHAIDLQGGDRRGTRRVLLLR